MLVFRALASFAPLAAFVPGAGPRPAHGGQSELVPNATPMRAQQPFFAKAPWHEGDVLPPPADEKKKKPAIDRDFRAYPTLPNAPRMEHDLWLAGDVHGDYFRYTQLLLANDLIAPVGDDDVVNPYPPLSPDCDTTPTFRWSGKDATLVQTGDVIDKGYWNGRILHLHMNLEKQAEQAGGRFVMTLGNHEVAFLKEPINGKSTGPGGLALELWGCNVEPEVFASTKHPMGAWLQNRPIAVRIGPVLAGHGGQTSSRSLNGMSLLWKFGLMRDGWATMTLNGLNSFLRARDFAGKDGHQGPDLVKALDPDVSHPVRHIVHAHNPEVGEPGEITRYGIDDDGLPTLIDIDVGMTRFEDYSKGWLLHLMIKDDQIVAEQCNHKGKCETLWREPVIE